MNAISRPVPALDRPGPDGSECPDSGSEPDADRRARQRAYFRRLSDLNMAAAELAYDRLERAHHAEANADAAAATLDLTRASRAVSVAAAAENRIVDGPMPARTPSIALADRRRAPLRQALHAAAEAEPNQAARADLRRQIDEAVEDTLAADPDAGIPLVEHLYTVAEILHLDLDPAKLSDELLGLDPPPRSPPTGADRDDAPDD